jgi:tetratricopeptide (TPR) repeat protein
VPTLRVSVRPGPDGSNFSLELRDAATPVPAATGSAGLRFSAYDQATLRWYYEDYLRFPAAPGPEIAGVAEGRIRDLGEEWFRLLFSSSAPARAVWAAAEPVLGSLRIEVDDATAEGAAIGWELVRPPGGEPLALRAREFVRMPALATAAGPAAPADALRVLLVVARPAGVRDVPFRAVARTLLDEADRAGSPVEVEVLRPATFENLQATLAAAREDGRPFDAVHFDGHGAYQGRTPRGSLVFEGGGGDGQLVPGNAMGATLRVSGVRILVLNACRSAHVDPDEDQPDAVTATRPQPFPSFAVEALRSGAPSVLAMRYDVSVGTAVVTMAALYRALGQDATLGEAVTAARRALAGTPGRAVAGPSVEFADWGVPVVFESGAPPAVKRAGKPSGAGQTAVPAPETFIGRDGAILSLDRAFDVNPVVVLRGMCGSGKSATAAEFAAWYRRTGAADGALRVLDGLDDRDDEAMAGIAESVRQVVAYGGKVLLVACRDLTRWFAGAPAVRLGPLELLEELDLIALVRGRRDDLAPLPGARGNPRMILSLLGAPGGADAEAVVRRRLTERFTAAERETLGLLAFFTDRADLEVLASFTAPNDYFAPFAQTGVTAERWAELLTRSDDAGLAEWAGGTAFLLHPALGAVLPGDAAAQDAAEEALVTVLAGLGEKWSLQYRHGDPQAVRWSRNEQENLHAAFDRVLRRGAWELLIGVMNGLLTLYESAERFERWNDLLDRVVPLIFGADGLGPAHGREMTWGFVSEFVMERRLREGDRQGAFRLQQTRIAFDREVVRALGEDPPELADLPQFEAALARVGPARRDGLLQIMREDVTRGLAVSMTDLGDQLRDGGDAGCVSSYLDALRLFAGLHDTASFAKTSYGLSRALVEVPGIVDLDAAEEMAGQSLRFRTETDVVGRAVSHGQLGIISHERARALPPGEQDQRRAELLAEATEHFQRALAGFPEWDLPHLGPANNQLGVVYMGRGLLEEGRRHLSQAIEIYERLGDPFRANSSRINLAVNLLQFRRFTEARLYVREAQAFFADFPDRPENESLSGLSEVIDEFERRWPQPG